MINLKVDGVVVPFEAMGEITQSYGWVGGFTNDRMMDGSLDGQETWRKRSTTIRAAGWVPPAFEGIDWSAPHTIDCVGQVSIASPATSIVLPTARRSDVDPFAFAVMPTGLLSQTDSSLTGDVLTITAVTGAVSYQAVYYPRLVCRSAGQNNEHQLNTAVLGWELTLEEV